MRHAKRGPVYKFEWRSSTSVHAESWAEFYEGASQVHKPRFARLPKTASPRKQIGTKTITVEGKPYEVKVFEAGRPNGCFRFWANPRRKQANPNRAYDADQTKGILAHIPTARDVDAAIDGDQEAREFLQQYQQIRDGKSSPLHVVGGNPEDNVVAPQSACGPIGQASGMRALQKEKPIDVDLHGWRDSSTVRELKPEATKHERIDVSDLRTVPVFNISETRNTINGETNAA